MSGQLPKAEASYRQLLAVEPANADILFHLGVLLHQTGRHNEAVESLTKAIAIDDKNAPYHSVLGAVLQVLGRSIEALAHHRKAVELRPDAAEAYNNLAITLRELGRLDEAASNFRRAAEIKPNSVETLNNLGLVLRESGHLDDAVASFHAAILSRPDFADAYNNLGVVQRDLGKLNDAADSYRKALALRPAYAEAHNNLGLVLQDLSLPNDAVASYRQAVAFKPDYAEAYNNLGVALESVGHLDEAMACIKTALELKPNFPEAHRNLGSIRHGLGQFDQADASYRRALELRPDYAEAHTNLGYMLLRSGKFRQGWAEREWRHRSTGAEAPQKNEFPHPVWTGERSPGATILLWSDEGLGDAIQFVRYVPQVLAKGWQVILGAPPELVRLFATIPAVRVQSEVDFSTFDTYCSLLSLPHVFGTTLETIPRAVPYLHAAPDLTAQWRGKLAPLHGLKLGIVWRGRPTHRRDRRRSLTPALFARLLDIPGLAVVSLQKDGRPDELAALGVRGPVFNAGPQFGDFADTAAAVANLDLVICVDTSIAHLAGALGRPVWTLLDFVPDWRWLTARDDSPWYPTMRLFRQPRLGDWDAVIETVKAELSRFVEQRQ